MKAIYAKDLKAMKLNKEEMEIAKKFAKEINANETYCMTNFYVGQQPSQFDIYEEVVKKFFNYAIKLFRLQRNGDCQFDLEEVVRFIYLHTGLYKDTIKGWLRGMQINECSVIVTETLDLNHITFID